MANWKHKQLADLFESFIAAIYIDSNSFEHCRGVFETCFYPRLKEFIVQQSWNDPKSCLQQCCLTLREEGQEPSVPRYRVLDRGGPTHQSEYEVAVFFKNQEIGKATGKSIQDAEMKAAKQALNDYYFPQREWQKQYVGKKYDGRDSSSRSSEPKKWYDKNGNETSKKEAQKGEISEKLEDGIKREAEMDDVSDVEPEENERGYKYTISSKGVKREYVAKEFENNIGRRETTDDFRHEKSSEKRSRDSQYESSSRKTQENSYSKPANRRLSNSISTEDQDTNKKLTYSYHGRKNSQNNENDRNYSRNDHKSHSTDQRSTNEQIWNSMTKNVQGYIPKPPAIAGQENWTLEQYKQFYKIYLDTYLAQIAQQVAVVAQHVESKKAVETHNITAQIGCDGHRNSDRNGNSDENSSSEKIKDFSGFEKIIYSDEEIDDNPLVLAVEEVVDDTVDDMADDTVDYTVDNTVDEEKIMLEKLVAEKEALMTKLRAKMARDKKLKENQLKDKQLKNQQLKNQQSKNQQLKDEHLKDRQLKYNDQKLQTQINTNIFGKEHDTEATQPQKPEIQQNTFNNPRNKMMIDPEPSRSNQVPDQLPEIILPKIHEPNGDDPRRRKSTSEKNEPKQNHEK